MEKTIKTLIKRLEKFQKALDWEIENRSKGLSAVSLDCENEVQWAKYDSNWNIQGTYFVRVYFENRVEIRKKELYDRHILTIKIIAEKPFTVIIHIDIEEIKSSFNSAYIDGDISVQVFNEEKETVLPLIFYLEKDDFVKELKKEVEFFMDYSGVQDEGLIRIDGIIEMIIYLLKNKNVSFDIFD